MHSSSGWAWNDTNVAMVATLPDPPDRSWSGRIYRPPVTMDA
jgi:hypothetical protein